MIEAPLRLESNGQRRSCCCATGSSNQRGERLRAPCCSFIHPQIPFHAYSDILLSAWAVVVRAYYGEGKIALLNIIDGVRDEDAGGKEKDKVEFSSFSASLDATVRQLRSAVLDAKANASPINLLDVQERAGVVLFPPDDLATEESLKSQTEELSSFRNADLVLAAQPCREGAVVNIFSPQTTDIPFRLCSLMGSLQKAVQNLMYHPTLKVSDINIVSDHDLASLQQRMVKPAYDSPNCIHGLINRHYHEQPRSTAIASTAKAITYEDLGKRSAAATRVLKARGITQGSLVGVRMSKSVAALIAIVGILRAGAAYVPMEPSCPADRMQSIMKSAGIKHLVGDDSGMGCREGVDIIDPRLLEEADIPNDWKSESERNPDTPAYIMFTSGSTGVPKGVVHTQQRVAGGLLEVASAFGLSKATRFLQYASFSFDASICEMFAPLVIGGTVCIPTENERLEDIGGAMRQLEVTDATLTPVVISQLQPDAVPSLHDLYVGGEAPNSRIVNTWSDRVQLNNVYGTTEAGVWDTVKRGLGQDDNPKNIGDGIGANIFIVDPSDINKLQPIGVEGELLVQSPYIGQGYLGDKEKESKAFVSSPPWMSDLGGDTKIPIYRTGDLVKYNADGNLIFSGRQSGFIKIRGLRIELGEVEASINTVLKKGRTGVIAANTEEKKDELEIVAFVEASDSDTSVAEHVWSELKHKLPSYMIPTIIIPIEAMPLTDSKKINRQSLHAHLRAMTSFDIIQCRPGGASATQWNHIASTSWLATRLNEEIVNMLEEGNGGKLDCLRGRDFVLSSVGLTSVQLAYLSGFIRRQWDKSLGIPVLQLSGLTVGDLEALILDQESKLLEAQQSTTKTNILTELQAIQPDVRFCNARMKTQVVLCTSITGFLGSQILRSLLECPEIDRIIGLVRAKSDTEARDKVKEQGVLGQWWQDEYSSRIETWLGDLSRPKLGLNNQDWKNLTGGYDIDAIIHNGARVNWIDDFAALKATNVQSTSEILKAISSMEQPCALTYISGGYLPSPEETKEEIADKLSVASGYDQTKFLSRLLLEEFNSHLDRTGDRTTPRAQIIQPGFIVGTQEEGISHIEDFLWRLAVAILSTGSVGNALRQAYIPVAGVDQISSMTVDSALGRWKGSTNNVTDCHDGIFVFNLCDVLSSKTGIKIRAVNDTEWLNAVRSDIENASFDHPFLPVIDWFEENLWQFSPEVCRPPEKRLLDERATYTAIEKSVEYMVGIGYLPSQAKSRKDINGAPVFRRSKAVHSV